MEIEWSKSHLIDGSDTALRKLSGGKSKLIAGFDTALSKSSGEIPARCGFRHCAMETEWGKSQLVVGSNTTLWKTVAASKWGFPIYGAVVGC